MSEERSVFQGDVNERAWRGAEIRLVISEERAHMKEYIDTRLEPINEKLDKVLDNQNQNQTRMANIETVLGLKKYVEGDEPKTTEKVVEDSISAVLAALWRNPKVRTVVTSALGGLLWLVCNSAWKEVESYLHPPHVAIPLADTPTTPQPSNPPLSGTYLAVPEKKP